MSLNVGDSRSRMIRFNTNTTTPSINQDSSANDFILESSVVTKENNPLTLTRSSAPTSLFLNADLAKIEEQKRVIAQKDLLPDSVVYVKAKEPIKTDTQVSTTNTTIAKVSDETFLVKHKTHLLILGGVVLAYIAYKKFKK